MKLRQRPRVRLNRKPGGVVGGWAVECGLSLFEDKKDIY